MLTYNKTEFSNQWLSSDQEEGQMGIALLLEPSPAFYKEAGEKENKLSWALILRYLKQSRGQIAQVILALLIVSVIQLIFPFLTQGLVDSGINVQNMQYVVIVLLAQLMLTFSKTIVDFIRSRLLLRISNVRFNRLEGLYRHNRCFV